MLEARGQTPKNPEKNRDVTRKKIVGADGSFRSCWPGLGFRGRRKGGPEEEIASKEKSRGAKYEKELLRSPRITWAG